MQLSRTATKTCIAAVCAAVAIIIGAPAAASAQAFIVPQYLQSEPGAPTGPSGVKTADVNKDGNLDLLWLTNQHDLEVRLGHGDGTFEPAGFLIDTGLRSSAGGDAAEFEVADVNHDSKPDVVVGGGEEIAVLLGQGNGTFGPPLRFIGSRDVPDDTFDSLALADFDHDGNIDAVTGNGFGVQIFFGNGDGTFRTPTKDFDECFYVSNVEAGDLDHDGNADIVFWEVCSNTMGVKLRAWFGDGKGNFPTRKTVFIGTELMQLFVKDLNGDARADILGVSGFDNAALRTWLTSSGQTFARHSASISAGWNSLSGMGVGDFDLDGKLDLAVAAFDSTKKENDAVLLFSRNSDGTLNSAKVFTVGGPYTLMPSAVVSGDFNKDGKADLAVSMFGANEVQVWINTTSAFSCSKYALYTVHLCSPVDGASYSSPVPVNAAANSDHSISGWKVYLNGVSADTGSSGSTFKTSVSLPPGSHRVTVKAWDSTGRSMSATANITVH